MASLGFDGYAIDYVDCPAGMHWWLQRELNLHRTVSFHLGLLDFEHRIYYISGYRIKWQQRECRESYGSCDPTERWRRRYFHQWYDTEQRQPLQIWPKSHWERDQGYSSSKKSREFQ